LNLSFEIFFKCIVLCPACCALSTVCRFGADAAADACADADAAVVPRPSLVTHTAVCDSLREPPPFVAAWLSSFFVLSAATCYSCSIYCVFLMSKLHFIMSLVRGKAYDRMGEKGETSSLATYARCWLLGCCWCCWLCCCGCKFYLSFNIFYALYAPPVRRLVRKQPRPATHFK